MKSIGNCNTFLSFKGITQAYLLYTQQKILNPLLNLLIKWKSAKSAPQMLSIKGKSNFLLLNFLIIRLCNCFANYLLETFSCLKLLPQVFLLKSL